MAIERVVGIDFGTSTSYVKVKRYEDGQPWGNDRYETKAVTFGGDGNIACPTVVQQAGENYWFGIDAEIKKPNGIIYRNFKIDLESKEPEKRSQARILTQLFLEYLFDTYKAQSHFIGAETDVERTLISFPAKWSEETRQFMQTAAKNAGFSNVTGVDEASAAINAVMVLQKEDLKNMGVLYGNRTLTLLLLDMGAGTTDIALCRYTPGQDPRTDILAVWPKADNPILFGGREIDESLGKLLSGILQSNGVQQNISSGFADKRLPEIKKWKEHIVSETLNRNKPVEYCDLLNQTYDLLEISAPPFPKIDQTFFENTMHEYLAKLPELINGCLDYAKKTVSGFSGGDSIDFVVITGGHCQWYFVKNCLCGNMSSIPQIDLPKLRNHPERVLQLVRPQETVSLGLVYKLLREEEFSSHIKNTKPLPKLEAKPPQVVAPPPPNQPFAKAPSGLEPKHQIFKTDHLVESVAISPDGKFVAAGEFISRKVMLWNTQTGTTNSVTVDESFLFPSVKGLAFSEDNCILATGSNDYKLKIWDMRTLECKSTFAGNRLLDQDSLFKSILFDPTGQYLITADIIHGLQFWDWKKGACIKTFTNQKKGVNCLAISRNGKWLVSGAADKSVCVRRLSDYSIVYSINNQSAEISSVSISDDNRILAYLTDDNKFSIYDTENWNLLNSNKETNSVNAIVLSRDGKYIFYQCSDNNDIAMRSTVTFDLVRKFTGHEGSISSLTISRDGNWLISGSSDQSVRMWKIEE